MKTNRAIACAVVILLSVVCVAANDLTILVGTRQDGPGRGLSLARFDTETGALSEPRLAYETPQPVFFVPGDAGNVIYVCHGLDMFDGQTEGFVSAFAVDQSSHKLALLNQRPIGGRGASHLNLDRTGRYLLEASYRSGHVAVFALEPDGRIGARTALIQHTGRSVHPERQSSPHPHSIYTDATNRFVLVPDLGLDRIFVYRFDATTGALTAHEPAATGLPPGTGPRHLAWHPDGRHAYVIDELTNAVTAFAWDATAGTLTAMQTISTLAVDFTGKNTAAEIAVHPGGRFLYASNRGDDNSITVFAIDPASGELTFVEREPSRGKWPRNFTIDPEGRWMVVSNHDSDSLVVFRIDSATGGLSPVGDPVAVINPFGTRFLPASSR